MSAILSVKEEGKSGVGRFSEEGRQEEAEEEEVDELLSWGE